MHLINRSWLVVVVSVSLACGTWGKTLRIASYNIDCADQGSDNNITGSVHSLPIVVEAMGLHHIGLNAQPVDVMGAEELRSTSLSNLCVQLNLFYGAGAYAFDPTADPTTGGGTDGLIYRTNSVQIISARALKTGTSVLLQSNGIYTNAYAPGGGVNGVTRAPLIYQIRPLGYSSNYDIYIRDYSLRFATANGTGNLSRRSFCNVDFTVSASVC